VLAACCGLVYQTDEPFLECRICSRNIFASLGMVDRAIDWSAGGNHRVRLYARTRGRTGIVSGVFVTSWYCRYPRHAAMPNSFMEQDYGRYWQTKDAKFIPPRNQCGTLGFVQPAWF